VQDELGLIN